MRQSRKATGAWRDLISLRARDTRSPRTNEGDRILWFCRLAVFRKRGGGSLRFQGQRFAHCVTKIDPLGPTILSFLLHWVWLGCSAHGCVWCFRCIDRRQCQVGVVVLRHVLVPPHRLRPWQVLGRSRQNAGRRERCSLHQACRHYRDRLVLLPYRLGLRGGVRQLLGHFRGNSTHEFCISLLFVWHITWGKASVPEEHIPK